MTTIIATKAHRYGTRQLVAGDEYETRNARDAKLMTAIGKARYVTDEELAKRSAKEAKAEAKAFTAVKAPEPAKVQEPAKQTEPVKTTAETSTAPQKKSDELTADELLDLVDDLPFLTFKSKATQILGADTPSTKADIIAALELHAENS